MPRGELRISGLLQAVAIAVFLALRFNDEAPSTGAPLWPWVLGAYGGAAAVLPWLTGGLGAEELTLRMAAVLGLLFALPMALAAWGLMSSPYPLLAYGCGVLVAAWALFAVACVTRASRRRTP